MPLPLLIPIGLGIAGAFELGKGIKGAIDSSKATDVNLQAQNLFKESQDSLKRCYKQTQNGLMRLGKSKIEMLSEQMNMFVTNFRKIKAINFTESAGIEELIDFQFDDSSLAEWKESSLKAQEVATGLGIGAGAGVLVAFGAHSATMIFASAGTGTAISTLSGIAASNATLAWLGGGTLAAGGLGVAGGMFVLGVMVAGPALLIAGSIIGSKGQEKLNNAYSNLAEAKKNAEELSVLETKMIMIAERARQIKRLLKKICSYFDIVNGKLIHIIQENGTNWNDYPEKDRKSVFIGVKVAQLAKTIADIPILNKKGEFNSRSHKLYKSAKSELEKLEALEL